MEYGAEILKQLHQVAGDLGGMKSEVASLRRDFDRARDESSDRLKALEDSIAGDISGLSEASQTRDQSVQSLREEIMQLRVTVGRCPQHVDPDAPVKLRRREDSGKLRDARRGVLRGLAALFGTLATALGGWWATHSDK